MITVADHSSEVEAKFTVDDPKLLHKLAQHLSPLSGYYFSEAITKVIQDVYLDTPDFRLLRHGYQLRVRTGDGQAQAALKSRGIASDIGIYHRLEIEEPLDSGSRPVKIGELPNQITDALSEIAGKNQTLAVISISGTNDAALLCHVPTRCARAC